MSNFIQIVSEDGDVIYLEAPESPEALEIEDDGPFFNDQTQLAGFGDRVQRVASQSREAAAESIRSALRFHGRLFLEAVRAMPEPPAEAEFSFGLKATAEANTFVVSKISGEVTYSVRIMWRSPEPTRSGVASPNATGYGQGAPERP